MPRVKRVSGLGRAAIFAVSTVSASACGAATGLEPLPESDAALVDGGSDAGRDGAVEAMYGGPPPLDAGFDAGLDAGPQIITLYGGPTPVFDAGDDEDGGSVGDLYGAPPPA